MTCRNVFDILRTNAINNSSFVRNELKIIESQFEQIRNSDSDETPGFTINVGFTVNFGIPKIRIAETW